MSTQGTARAAVLSCLALVLAACAAERLEARDPQRGPTGAASSTTPVVRPTVLQTPEKTQPPPAVEALYVCPMHPEVQSSKPGDCSKCGMTLTRKERAP